MQPRDQHGNMINIEKQNRRRRAIAKKIVGAPLTEEEARMTARHEKRHSRKVATKKNEATNA
jgi:hypothetical protein